MPNCSLRQFKKILSKICRRDTSFDTDGWSPQNPLYGHCAVVALVAHEQFGGQILKASLKAYPRFAHMKLHFFNRLPNGMITDFTRSQFGNHYPKRLTAEVAHRSSLMRNESTSRRYNKLRLRLLNILKK